MPLTTTSYLYKEDVVKEVPKPVFIEPPAFEEEKEEKEQEETAPLPSREEVEKEIEQLKAQAEERAQQIIKEAEEEAKKIREEAENWAFQKVKEATEEYERKLREAQIEAERIISDAKKQEKEILREAEDKAIKVHQEAYQKGYQEGYDQGFATGKEEVDRLITRLNVIISTVIRKRNEIIQQTQEQLIDLALTIARKVVKTIPEQHKRVIFDNIMEALKRLRGKAEVVIRVNPDDLHIATKHKREFIAAIEGLEHIKFIEDTTVDKGGCIVETDFGQIDARIETQLSEIEKKVKEATTIVEQLY